MPMDKNKMMRYLVLDRCFKDTSRLYKSKDILECVNHELQRYDYNLVKIRSIQNDIRELQDEPYNVVFDEVLREDNIYRYADTTQSLKVLKLIDSNHDALTRTIESLREKYNDPENQNPQWQWMLLTLQAIADNRPVQLNKQYVSFENNEVYAGNVYFAPLLECIINQHPATIRYQPFHHQKSTGYNIHPYYLKQYNSRWFLFARIDGKDEMTNFALDRIHDIKPWKHPYVSTDVDFSTYFDDVVGVSINDAMPLENVTIKISARRYQYIETKPFSEKQDILMRDKDYYTITFPIRINNEFVAKILSLGSDVEVIQPQKLRTQMAAIVNAMKEKY